MGRQPRCSPVTYRFERSRESKEQDAERVAGFTSRERTFQRLSVNPLRALRGLRAMPSFFWHSAAQASYPQEIAKSYLR